MRNKKANIFSFLLYAGYSINIKDKEYYTICIVQICTILRFHLGNWIAEDSRLSS